MSDIIETLRRLQCSDAACKDLQIAMGAKLAIYEIERLRAERNDAVKALNQITNAPYCAFVRNGWMERMVFVEIGLTYEFMEDCPDLIVETIAGEIKNAMFKATKPTNDWIQVDFKQEEGK